MSNLLIFRPLAAASITATTGTGAANLLTPDPKEVWTAAATGADNVDIDFGVAVEFDCVMVGFTNATAAATMSIAGGATYTAASYATVQPLRRPESIGPRHHGLYWRPGVPFGGRYLRLAVGQGAGGPPLQIGVVAVGKAFQPAWNREWGAGRRPLDTGAKQRLRSGGFGVGRGAKVPAYQWTFGDLTNAEVDALWALAMAVGETDPVVVVEDPDNTAGLAERVHYGLFDRFEAFEREDPNLNRWALSMEGWG